MTSPKDAMPWVGLYIAGASLLCTLAMLADLVNGITRRQFWFPYRFFTINAASLTLIAVAMKLPMDLTTQLSGDDLDQCARYFSMNFLIIILANFVPSLGLMGQKEFLMNIIALGILITTLIVNMLIQTFTQADLYLNITYMTFLLMLPFSIALIVPTSKTILENKYMKLHSLDLTCQKVNFSSKELRHNVKKHWMMTNTGELQFMIVFSPICYALEVICTYIWTGSISYMREILYNPSSIWHGESDYKWSIHLIFVVQSFGIIVGGLAPCNRCILATVNYKKWCLNDLNVFKVEKYWTEMLQQWRHVHVHSHIPIRHSKAVLHVFKNTFLNLCVGLQITIVVICKTICLVFISFHILIRSLLIPLFRRLKDENNTRSEMEEYIPYVIQLEEEKKATNSLLNRIWSCLIRILDESEKKEPIHLVKLLEKSKGFNGVLEFENDQVPPLHSEECHNSWSLVAVTLTAIAIALPNIAKHNVKEFSASMREGLEFIRHVEENLNEDGKALVKARKASRHVWTKVELYYNWLHIDLRNDTPNGKTSKEILQWLGDEAAKVAIRSMTCKTDSPDYLTDRFLAASSMYRISQSILLHFIVQDNWPNDEEVFEWVTSIVADVLCACFTNLPRVITMKCHNEAIEKRAGDIRAAARLLGKSKKILEILESRQLPDIDLDSMAYIDKWRVLLGNQMHDPDDSLVMIQPNTSHDNESMIVTIMGSSCFYDIYDVMCGPLLFYYYNKSIIVYC